jgi:hypothetical protein
MVLIDVYPHEVSAAMEGSARFVVVLLLRHLAAAEFSENRDRLFASVEPINTYAVIGVGVFRDLEHIGRSVVVKFHGQRIRREDVVGDVTAPLSGDVLRPQSKGGGTTIVFDQDHSVAVDDEADRIMRLAK